jgi:hypothetical protein
MDVNIFYNNSPFFSTILQNAVGQNKVASLPFSPVLLGVEKVF